MSHRAFPRAGRLRRGYHCRQVDAFFARAELAASGAGPAVTPTDVRRVGFELVRHGYAPGPVDALLDELEEQVVARQDVGGGGRRGVFDPAADLRVLREELATAGPDRFRRARRWRRGYRRSDVDSYLQQLAPALTDDPSASLDDVRRVSFRPQRGGYEERAVDETLDRVIETLMVHQHRTRSGGTAANPNILRGHG